MIAAAHRVHRLDESGPDCTVCRRPSREALRERWGCDKPSAIGLEVFQSTCTRCYGTEDECDTCGGSGVQLWNRCPASQTDDWSMYVAEVYEMLSAHHTWPDGQPWEEQDNLLYSAVRLYGNEVAKIREAAHKAAMKRHG